MSEEDYDYMLKLDSISKAVRKIEGEGATKVGKQVNTSKYRALVEIAGLNYGSEWYIIGYGSEGEKEYNELNLSDTNRANLGDYGPYIVKYGTGAVQSTVGKLMYEGTENETWIYTFNYTGEEGGLVTKGMLAGVNESSRKTENEWGVFTETDYNSSYYTDNYTYDGNGGLVLTDTTKILSMDVDQTKPVNSQYSVNITIKCDTYNQWGFPSSLGYSPNLGGTILAMSDIASKYVLRAEINRNYLRIWTFSPILPEGEYSGVDAVLNEYSAIGFICIDISEYNGKYLNLQITAKKGEKSRVYINGVLKSEFESGRQDYTYEYLTIGDLRNGRLLKYRGNVYNFALYGRVLTESEIVQNWNYSKNTLGIK